ncbi:MAG: class I SAM-dependent methyltransferase [Ilumatobacter sp.]|uniref:class I SAM-dependent methyltransferase n=1 Tax=Ilumatobacter sp. TaxID=1967498 RepID=UPI003C715F83
MPLALALLTFVVVQIAARVWLRIRPRAIPFGWSWLLENPWRKSYRNPERVAEQCGIKPTDTVLEIGCGSGLFTRSLATRCAKLIAHDLEPRYIAQTRAKLVDLSHIEYLVGDARDLQLDGVVDVIVLISVLPEIPEPLLALEACKRALRPGGRVVIGEELFEPEYVTSGRIDSWARAVGFDVVGREGNAWAYLTTFALPTGE